MQMFNDEICYLISSIFLFILENAHVPDSVTLCTWSPSRVSCAATCTVARRAAEDDLDRVRVHAAEIASGDRDRATGDRDPKIVGKGMTKVGMADLEDINYRKWFFIPTDLTLFNGRTWYDRFILFVFQMKSIYIHICLIYYIFIRVINRISALQHYIIC